ncbi:hypothetical protein NEOLI_001428 [Neolecta irregularis DAH-3]|uniref:Uncharacterized protein n=1 Tax=Neolecta irregularis (strain DAH-3) TaxID=1198029 RepID=A0A1U7LG88_NEOID|nr:hypothetical protein NEOLI_001428 [Neolecta irregularis DAH-3]|eukprot:OLL21659.1 hypothetical protein NEOLI_001428 [Neolecta irregularis DAH-3]
MLRLWMTIKYGASSISRHPKSKMHFVSLISLLPVVLGVAIIPEFYLLFNPPTHQAGLFRAYVSVTERGTAQTKGEPTRFHIRDSILTTADNRHAYTSGILDSNEALRFQVYPDGSPTMGRFRIEGDKLVGEGEVQFAVACPVDPLPAPPPVRDAFPLAEVYSKTKRKDCVGVGEMIVAPVT